MPYRGYSGVEEPDVRAERVEYWYRSQEPEVREFLDEWCKVIIQQVKLKNHSVNFSKENALELRFQLVRNGWV